MRKHVAGALVAGVVLVAAGGAVAVANSVDTTPEPAHVSHYTDSTDAPTTVGSPVSAVGTTPATVDDHGGDRDRRTDGPAPPATVDDHGRSGRDRTTDDTTGGTAVTVADSTPATVDDSTTPGTVDDHGGDRGGRGRGADDPDGDDRSGRSGDD